MNDKNWFDALSEILNKPLPGTAAEKQTGPSASPAVFNDDADDASLLDRITDVLTRPLPGSEPAGQTAGSGDTTPPPRENPGETAVRDAGAGEDDEPVSTTATAGADWMQREYERFADHQERARQAFSEHQRQEQEKFAAYQQAQLQRFMQGQTREREVFRGHQEARSQAWRQDLRQTFTPPPGPQAGPWGPGTRPPPPPPPPPPWWRKR
jgi:hypothetical protein